MTKKSSTSADACAALLAGGEMGAHTRALDGSQTLLEPPCAHPHSPRTQARMIPGSRDPLFICRGEAPNTFYDEQQRVGAESRERQTRFRTTTDTAPGALWITGACGACTFVPRGWYEDTRQSEQEAARIGGLVLAANSSAR